MDNKRGWIKILEATIAVMLVSGVLLVVYSQQNNKNAGPEEYIYSLQKQILMDISSRSDLRNDALSGNNASLNLYVRKKIPLSLSYSLKVCDLTLNLTPCKLSPENVIATSDENVYAAGTILSADFASGYHPKKVKLFIWRKVINNSCGPSCSPDVSSNLCSDSTTVKNITCGYFKGNGCSGNLTTYQTCKPNEICKNGTCESIPVKCGPPCSPSKTCSPDSKEVLTQTCKVENGCLEYNATTHQKCGPTKICKNEVCVNAYAKLSATISPTVRHDNSTGAHFENYTLVIKETNGVGVNITSGRQCFDSIGCQSWASYSPPRRVPANGQYTRNSYWWTWLLPHERYWTEYRGKDDYSHSIRIIRSNNLTYPW